MTVRVLHVFSPFFRQRYAGPIHNYRFYFSQWNDPAITHFVLDTEQGIVLPGKQALDFTFTADQKMASALERLFWIPRLHRNLAKYRAEYDLIHFHILWWGSLLMAAWARSQGIPTIYESVLSGSDTPQVLQRETFGRVKLNLLKQFTSILALSDGIAEQYLRAGFPPDQVHAQLSGLDASTFRPAGSEEEKKALKVAQGFAPDDFIFLFVGSLIERKGVDLLVSAFVDLALEFPQARLCLVGPQSKEENPSIDEAFIASLKGQIREKQLDSTVQFRGLIQDRAKLAEIFQCADVFVLPSRDEGLPNVILEAFSVGLPVIVSDLPGLKRIAIDGQNSVVVPVGDYSSLKQTMAKLICEDDKRISLGKRAREYLLINHSFEAWQRKMADYYTQLMQNSRRINLEKE